jgi:hypothetical protein
MMSVRCLQQASNKPPAGLQQASNRHPTGLQQVSSRPPAGTQQGSSRSPAGLQQASTRPSAGMTYDVCQMVLLKNPRKSVRCLSNGIHGNPRKPKDFLRVSLRS